MGKEEEEKEKEDVDEEEEERVETGGDSRRSSRNRMRGSQRKR